MKLNHITIRAIIFLVCLFYIGAETLPVVVGSVGNMFKYRWFNAGVAAEWIDTGYRNMLGFEKYGLQNKGFYINLHGLMARAMGQRYINEVVKLDSGHLTEEAEREDIAFAALQLTKMCEMQKEKGKDFLFVLTPNQLSEDETDMPPGYSNYSNGNADELLSILRKSNVPVLDLREEMRKDGISQTEAFFITDHHWRPETGLWAYTKIIDGLIKTGAAPAVTSSSFDIDNYNIKVFQDIFLGSFGRRTGLFFAGVDDFSLLTPKFTTDISVYTPYSGEIDMRGDFTDININRGRIIRDFFNADPYTAYGHSEKGIVSYRNEGAPADLKVLSIGDSFSHVTYIYLPFIFSTCDQIDMRYAQGDFHEYLLGYDPDLLIIMVNPSQVMKENTTYDFFNEYQ